MYVQWNELDWRRKQVGSFIQIIRRRFIILLHISLIIVFVDSFFLSSLCHICSSPFFFLSFLVSSPSTLSSLFFSFLPSHSLHPSYFITSYHLPSLHHRHPPSLLSTTSPVSCFLTPFRYCSLELIVSDDGQPLDLRLADMFSLGASVYELCLGRELGVLLTSRLLLLISMCMWSCVLWVSMWLSEWGVSENDDMMLSFFYLCPYSFIKRWVRLMYVCLQVYVRMCVYFPLFLPLIRPHFWLLTSWTSSSYFDCLEFFDPGSGESKEWHAIRYWQT